MRDYSVLFEEGMPFEHVLFEFGWTEQESGGTGVILWKAIIRELI